MAAIIPNGSRVGCVTSSTSTSAGAAKRGGWASRANFIQAEDAAKPFASSHRSADSLSGRPGVTGT